MANTPKSSTEIKAFFETGDIPDESQFSDAWSSYPNIVDGNLLINSDSAITAHAGGGQGSAYAITKQNSVITTVATNGDSIVLPAALKGRSGTILNTQANYCNVFPAVGEYMTPLSTNEALPLYIGYALYFYCIEDGHWSIRLQSTSGVLLNLTRATATTATLDVYVSLWSTYTITALASALTINDPQYQAAAGQRITILITDNGTSRAITWGSAYRGLVFDLPTKTRPSQVYSMEFVWSVSDNTWYLISLSSTISTKPLSQIYAARVFVSSGSIDDVTVICPLTSFSPVWSYTATGILNVTLPSYWDFSKMAYRLTGGNALSSPALLINDEDAPSPIHIQMLNLAGAAISSGVFWFEVEYFGE